MARKRSPTARPAPAPIVQPNPGVQPVAAADSGGRLYVIAAIVLVVAVVLRLAGSANDLWLDEIWASAVANEMHSVFDTFTLHHEINHHLYTIWLYLIGPNGSALAYRSLSLVAGAASVAVAGLIGRRRSDATGVIAMLLVGLSYELVLFSSEARGYSMLVLCALLSYYFLDSYLAKPHWRSAALYGVSVILGSLSQPIFASVVAASCAWSAYRLFRSGRTPKDAAVAFLLLQAAPLIFDAGLYLIDLRFVVNGGGTPTESLVDAYGVALAWALGTPQAAALKLITCIVAVFAIDAGLRRLWREQSDAWVFFAGTIVAFPILLVIVRGSDLVYTRHFMVVTTFLLILLSGTLGAWWGGGRRSRLLCMGVLLAYAGVNGWHIADLLRHGRGHYTETLRYIAEQTPGSTVTIAGDVDGRVGVEVNYYLPRTMGSKQGRYLEQNEWPPEGPQWIIGNQESFNPPAGAAAETTDEKGNKYDLVRTVPAAPISGLHWFLYKRRDR